MGPEYFSDHRHLHVFSATTIKINIESPMVIKQLSKVFDQCDFKVLWLKLKLVVFYITFESYGHTT